MGSTRIKGTALALSFGGTDYWADVTSVSMENAASDSKVTTFEDASITDAAVDYTIKGTAIQSLQTTSFWRYCWEHSGDIVAFRYAPKGNTVASADEPHFVGSVRIGARPTVGGDAGPDAFTFDFEWGVQGDPTMDDGTDGVAVVSTISPAGQSAGDQVVLSGTRLSSATDVKFGTTSVPNLIVVSDTTLAVIIPTGTGVKQVTVVNPAGTSEAVPYTVAS